MKKTILFLVVVFALVIGITFLPKSEKINPILRTYTLDQIALHGDAQNCWTVIREDVYDLTPWINEHPGGDQAILSMCGKDATAAFEEQHGGQPNPENALKSFVIGKLKI